MRALPASSSIVELRTAIVAPRHPVDRLSILAVEIMAAHAEVEKAARRSIEAMIMAGVKLIEAKEMLRDAEGRVRGKWGPWLRDQCRIPARTATLYMNLARHRAILEAAMENGNVADFSVRAALALIEKAELAQWREEQRKAASVLPDSTDRYRLIEGDMGSVEVETGTIDAIITDPPYCEQDLELYSTLARQASRWLKPGGSLSTLAGHAHLPEIMQRLCGVGLTYQWTIASVQAGPTAHIHKQKIFACYKPVLWYTHGPYSGSRWKRDVIKGAGRSKQHHKWEQAEAEFAQLIEAFTEPGDLILDPFLGGGTTGAAALKLGRRFVGVEVDPQAFALAKARIAALPRD
jgi:16S rRNA G966 N2-methylase RsmD